MNIQRLLPTIGPNSNDAERDPLQLIATFRRRLRVFVAAFVLVLAAVLVFTLQQTPRYTATSYVMIDTRKRDVSKIDEVLSGLPADSSAVDTEVEILKSRSLATRVVQHLHLDRDPEFNKALQKPSLISAVVSAPKQLFHSAAPILTAQSLADQKVLNDRKEFDAVVDRVLKRLKVSRAGLTYVIGIDFTSTNAAKASDIANAFSQD
jgi:succinoglycan biosynthesis transport protein ExoP